MMPSAFCRICYKPLTDPTSVRMGIGPDCLKRVGEQHGTDDVIDLPWDDETRDIVFQRVSSSYMPESGFVPVSAFGELPTREKLHFNIPQVHRHHSPSGFEWGYGGSGPADFALNILAIFTDMLPERPLPEWEYLWDKSRCHPLVWAWHQEFKRDFIERAPGPGMTIHGDDIRAWIDHKLNADQS